jgi:hypothetical protein
MINSLLLFTVIFGKPVGVLIGQRIEKISIGDRLDNIHGILPFLRIGAYALLWWLVCMWFFVDFLNVSS